jgi:hypothetical protein
MNTDGVQNSAALVTVEFIGKRDKTQMTYTEQAAFLDPTAATPRTRGTEVGFDRLVLAIEGSLAALH